MKTTNCLVASALMILSACSSTRQAGNNADDVYYTNKDVSEKKPVVSDATATPPSDARDLSKAMPADNPANYSQGNDYASEGQPTETSSSEVQKDEEGNTYITNNYYDRNSYNYDDYYDYAYAVRLRRFYHPVYSYSYYDTYYTNSYLYSYNPWDWGVSVYLGYPWWGISYGYYSPGFSVSFGYGYPYYGNYYGYYPWHHHHYSDYYSWGNPWYNPYGYGYYGGGCNNGYWNGYANGYNDGYNDSYYGYNYNPNYYNSYDQTLTYYGPRTDYSSNGRQKTNTLGEKYQHALLAEKDVMRTEKTNVSKVPVTIKNENVTEIKNNPVIAAPADGKTIHDKAVVSQPVNSGKDFTKNAVINNPDVYTTPSKTTVQEIDNRKDAVKINDNGIKPNHTEIHSNPAETGKAVNDGRSGNSIIKDDGKKADPGRFNSPGNGQNNQGTIKGKDETGNGQRDGYENMNMKGGYEYGVEKPAGNKTGRDEINQGGTNKDVKGKSGDYTIRKEKNSFGTGYYNKPQYNDNERQVKNRDNNNNTVEYSRPKSQESYNKSSNYSQPVQRQNFNSTPNRSSTPAEKSAPSSPNGGQTKRSR